MKETVDAIVVATCATGESWPAAADRSAGVQLRQVDAFGRTRGGRAAKQWRGGN
jgi:hypothetical protein